MNNTCERTTVLSDGSEMETENQTMLWSAVTTATHNNQLWRFAFDGINSVFYFEKSFWAQSILEFTMVTGQACGCGPWVGSGCEDIAEREKEVI